ncbi:MAG: DivIVA domain-containing protein [Desulforudis sp.]|jgi:cell division initiation protein|nr:MAG: DivIVA domain-containing protein [Desulforudis sp.]
MIKPLDVRNKEFRRCFRGYDEQEVDGFLDHIVDSMEKMLQENTELWERVERMETAVAHYKELEDVLKSTMLIAQKTAQETKYSAEKESEVIIQEAQARATEILRQASQESEEILRKASTESERMLTDSREQAETVLRQAQREGSRVLDEATAKINRIMMEYEELQKQSKIFRAKFRSFLNAQIEMLDSDDKRRDSQSFPELPESAELAKEKLA